MLFYFLQTSLMLLVSYFLGCWLGCVLRHKIGSNEPVPVRSRDPLPVAPASAPLAPVQAPVRQPSATPTPRPASATEPAFRRTDLQAPPAPAQIPVAAVPASPPPPVAVTPPSPPIRPGEVRPAVVVVQPAAPAPVSAPAPTAAPRPTTVTGVSVTAAAAAAAAAAVAQGRAREASAGKPPADAILPPSAPASRESFPAAGASSGVSGVAVGGQSRPAATTGGDDLKRIRGIGPEIEAALHRIGVRRHSEVAGWSAGDVDTISKALSLKGRIAHENWIEQAQVLSKGGETAFSRRYDRGEMETAPKAQAAPAVAAPKVAPPPAPVPPAPAVVATPSAVSTATSSNQAAVTAAAAAAAAAQRTQTAAAVPAAPSPDRVRELSGILAGTVKPVSAPSVTPAVQPMTAPAAPAAIPAPAIVPSAAGDDLTRIRGVDPDTARQLAARGITEFAQIGTWTSADADSFGAALSLKHGRVQQESWIDQARLLAGMGPTPAPAAPRTDREDRAEGAGASWHQRQPNSEWTPKQMAAAAAAVTVATPGPQAQAPAATESATTAVAAAAAAAASAVAARAEKAPVVVQAAASAQTPPVPVAPDAPAISSGGVRVVRSGVPDDLKRIKGIGVVLEKKLHGLGIINYGQIAGWAQSDIDKMSEVLDFKGRIERENWIEQARILATGGVTDFARRVDRGEVETGSPRPVR